MASRPPDPLYLIRGTMSCVHHMEFKKNGDCEKLYVATSEGCVHIWDLMVLREINKIQVGNDSCLYVSYTESHFVTQQKCGDIKWWIEEGKEWKLMKTISSNYFGFCKICIYKNIVLFPKGDSVIGIDTFSSSNKLLKPKSSNLGNLMCLKYISKSNNVIAAYESGNVALWDMKELSLVHEITFLNGSDCFVAVDFSEVSCEGVLGSSCETLIKFNICDNKLIKLLEVTITNPGVSSIIIHPLGKLCVVGCWDGRIRYFSMKKLTLLAVLDHHIGSIECVIFSRERLNFGNSLVLSAGGKDGRISLWSLFEP